MKKSFELRLMESLLKINKDMTAAQFAYRLRLAKEFM